MDKKEEKDPAIPLICAHPSSVQSFQLFNPNEWTDESKAIILSCSSEHALLQHAVGLLGAICNTRKERCHCYFEDLRDQWKCQPWDVTKVTYYGQDPDLHLAIEAFLSGAKSLLDLIVQLASSEKIVKSRLDGFHRQGDVYGGKALNTLNNNASGDKRPIARDLADLINKHKNWWIDELIEVRDQLIHPPKGVHQVMFHILLDSVNGELVLKDILAPTMGDKTVDVYSSSILAHLKEFVTGFMNIVRTQN